MTKYSPSQTFQEDGADLEPDRKRSEASSDPVGTAPDARLASFLTGLLLSKPVSERLTEGDNLELRSGLFEVSKLQPQTTLTSA